MSPITEHVSSDTPGCMSIYTFASLRCMNYSGYIFCKNVKKITIYLNISQGKRI